MAERWLRELRKLGGARPSPGLWGRVLDRPPGRLPKTMPGEVLSRLVAGAVAMGLFGGALYGASLIRADRDSAPRGEAAGEARIICRTARIEVLTPVVALQPDGLHLRVENPGDRAAIVAVDPTEPERSWLLEIQRAQPSSIVASHISPRELAVGCVDASYSAGGLEGYARMTVTDPGNHWPALREAGSCGESHIAPASTVGADSPLAAVPTGRLVFGEYSRQGPVDGDLYSLDPATRTITPVSVGPLDDHTAELSPDGTLLAFMRQDEDADGNLEDAEIYVMNADGSSPMRLTDNDAEDSSPTWAADGSRLAFISDRDGSHSLYVMNADGSGVTRLVAGAPTINSPTWSPDGSKIAFLSDRGEEERFCEDLEIYVMNADGSGVTRLTDNEAYEQHLAWAPDGSRLAYSRSNRSDYAWEVYVIGADGSGERRLTDHPGYDARPVWSPDSTMIAFVSDRDIPDHEGDQGGWLYLMNADGSGVTRLTAPGADIGHYADDWGG